VALLQPQGQARRPFFRSDLLAPAGAQEADRGRFSHLCPSVAPETGLLDPLEQKTIARTGRRPKAEFAIDMDPGVWGILPVALAADWPTSTWDQNAASSLTTPAEAVVEARGDG
jgi:hypothetical protein